MSPAEYISSGILETYALGAATPAEKQDVENMLQKSAEVRSALEQIQQEIEAYATLHAVEPDEKLRDRILGSISTINPSNGTGENPKVISLKTEAAPSRLRSLAIAASLILVVSIAINIYQWRNVSAITAEKQRLDSAYGLEQAQRTVLTQEFVSASQKLEQAKKQLVFLRSPSTKNIPLNSVIKDKPMDAIVFLETNTMQLAVDPMTLPATSADQKYVLWAMVKGKPVNVGDFDLESDSGLMMLKISPEAEAYAISLEQSGNVTAPAGPVYVMGQVGASKP
jgi:anti-sigma-K factor RskA